MLFLAAVGYSGFGNFTQQARRCSHGFLHQSVPIYLRLRVGPMVFFMLFIKMFEKNAHFAYRGSADKVKHFYFHGFIGWSLNHMLKDFAGDIAYGNSRTNTRL